MSIKINNVQMHVLNMKTRMPFRYGIASLVALPHLFVRVEAEVDGKRSVGLAAEGLPPKWFTKNPDAPFEADLDEMLAVIRNAVSLATLAGAADSAFDLWRALYQDQKSWAESTAYPSLLWGFGVSLVERAVIDAACRAGGMTLATAVRNGSLGIRLGAIHPELEGKDPSDFLVSSPLTSIRVRHTVGLTDPLTDADIPDDERLSDGLPQSLEDNIGVYGLTHLKIN